MVIEKPGSSVEWLSGDICSYFPNLTGFYIYSDGVQGFTEDAFIACKKLEFFHLEGGVFEEIPINLFKENRNLLTFKLYDTPIERILPNQFHAHPNLLVVEISASQLEEFPVLSINSTNFNALYLHSSNLKDFPGEELLQKFPKLGYTAFNDNDIKCSRVDKLLSFFFTRKVAVYTFRKPKQREGEVGESSGFICIP